jgi:hypothetical protein
VMRFHSVFSIISTHSFSAAGRPHVQLSFLMGRTLMNNGNGFPAGFLM